MPETLIGSADYGNFKGTEASSQYSVDPAMPDSGYANDEFYWDNTRFYDFLGYYRNIPELKAAIDAKARWVLGKGFKSNELTEISLSVIKGFGRDSFNTILQNCVRTYLIGGDAFAEIIRDDDGRLANLKPLDPGTIRIVANKKGVIRRYEQVSRTETGMGIKKFEPEQILHFAKDRTADEVHGRGIVEAVEEIINMRNEAMADYRKLLHRNIVPVKLIPVDSDNTTEITTLKAKMDKAFTQGENIYVPKGIVDDIQILGTAPNSTLNPLPWIQQLNAYFYQALAVPQIIVGGAQEITEASAKIAYLSWEQSIEEEQLFIEEQILSQLNLEIDLEFPNSLRNELLSDQSKSETMQATTQEDTSVTNVGVNPSA